jgi:predicted transcriptional regulator
MSQTATRCDNERCSCDPCGCAACRCGVVSLGGLERRVISVLWGDARPELTGRDVANALPEYAYTTIVTVLDRLARKGLVRRTKLGRVNRFAATGTMAEHAAGAMHDALVTTREPDLALERFVELLTSDQASLVQRAIDGLDQPSH